MKLKIFGADGLIINNIQILSIYVDDDEKLLITVKQLDTNEEFNESSFIKDIISSIDIPHLVLEEQMIKLEII